MINEFERVVLTSDLPDYDLVAGDIGTVVMIHRGGEGYELEFIALDGTTIAVVTILASQIRRIRSGEIAHVRQVETTN